MYRVKEGCPGCGACDNICPVGAITAGSGLGVVITDDCIDCGVCVGTCPIRLIVKVTEKESPVTKGGSKKSPPAEGSQVKGGSTDAEADPGL
ncbi:MAG: 4Fe-4S binding protein [Bacillota bacterium]